MDHDVQEMALKSLHDAETEASPNEVNRGPLLVETKAKTKEVNAVENEMKTMTQKVETLEPNGSSSLEPVAAGTVAESSGAAVTDDTNETENVQEVHETKKTPKVPKFHSSLQAHSIKSAC